MESKENESLSTVTAYKEKNDEESDNIKMQENGSETVVTKRAVKGNGEELCRPCSFT